MARRVRSLYRWDGIPGQEHLERNGWISEASLRAWEYHHESDAWEFAADDFHDTVRRWKTARPDLHVPEELLVGDYEEVAR
ncbi:MAG TPA: hypothetical protein VMS98_05980 [Thermoanaerobaculia bacterium]|nr:hypothetical protein [Thermoanaerobaculia bacterium]